MAVSTSTVKVYSMATGELLRVTTTAGEARRAAELPTAGMIMLDWLNGTKPTARQVEARQRKADRNAERLALAEQAVADLAETVEARRAGSEFGLYADLNTDWQAGYDF